MSLRTRNWLFYSALFSATISSASSFIFSIVIINIKYHFLPNHCQIITTAINLLCAYICISLRARVCLCAFMRECGCVCVTTATVFEYHVTKIFLCHQTIKPYLSLYSKSNNISNDNLLRSVCYDSHFRCNRLSKLLPVSK